MPVEQLEAEQHAQLVQDYVTLQQEYAQILAQLEWTHTILAVIIEEEGGVVTLHKNVLGSYDGANTALNVYDDEENGLFIIETAAIEQ